MAYTVDDAIGGIKPFVQALSKLTAKQKEQRPSAEYAQNFNKFLAIAKAACPNVQASRWPNEVALAERAIGANARGAFGISRCSAASYPEIHTYALQARHP